MSMIVEVMLHDLKRHIAWCGPIPPEIYRNAIIAVRQRHLTVSINIHDVYSHGQRSPDQAT
jgi:hypothetical protein